MKSRELIREVVAGGGTLARTTGDHHIYKFPSGCVLSVPHGGRQNEVSPGALAQARRVMRKEATR